ncbi:adenylate kinase isoenzyme 1-like [Hyposmocoma kahamanoa]|uniref:adenylate kinase isoenzyme 1-like n=1 Tax=Hyposmocoma kahamanoa TaxID=1477025 RepID=UPI000E6D7598|nr:adenylate kinase isoenzyme 1-like [Hyposmocoma kahamanoa]
MAKKFPCGVCDEVPETKPCEENANLYSEWNSLECIDTEVVEPNCDFCEYAPIDTANKPIIWVLGGPGSGKGTQCDKIIAKYGFTHLSTGDLLRAEIKSGSDRAKQLSGILERGELVPNDIVLELLKDAILKNTATSNGFLIDGYPREESQGQAFEKSIAPVSIILYFEATPETLTKRLLGRAVSSGRSDDNEDTIKLRLKTFLENNDKVLAQYPDKLVRVRYTIRLKMNLDKTKVMSNAHVTPGPVDGATLEVVHNYVYLSQNLQLGKHNFEQEADRRIRLG